MAPPGSELPLAWRERLVEREQELVETAGQVVARVQF
jgi:hypothetical protein